jgi:hypothetical protein
MHQIFIYNNSNQKIGHTYKPDIKNIMVKNQRHQERLHHMNLLY